MSLLRGALRRSAPERERMSVDDYVSLLGQFVYQGNMYPLGGVQQTLANGSTERIGADFQALAQSAYAANGPVFACMLARQLAFSSVRFRWQTLRNGKGSDMFGTPELGLLERPWVGGTTQDMLSRILTDADLAGNSFWTRDGSELVRLRPDWVDIVVERRASRLGWRKLGYLFTEGGLHSGNTSVPLMASEVAHFAPIPDPLAAFRGMSWLTPIVREVRADQAMSRYKLKFLDNGATPNMVIKHDAGATMEAIQKFKQMMDESHVGVENAFKTLHLYPGADVTVVGANFKEIDLKVVQGAGETRIASAARVPPVIAGLSEGLQGSSLNAGNYASSRRQFADGTMHPLWQNVAGSLEPLLPTPPGGVRLWYDATDVPLLREDEKDAAEIAFTEAQTIRHLIDGGYTPESVQMAVESRDWRLLVHSGLMSVQLQVPGQDSVMGGTPSA